MTLNQNKNNKITDIELSKLFYYFYFDLMS